MPARLRIDDGHLDTRHGLSHGGALLLQRRLVVAGLRHSRRRLGKPEHDRHLPHVHAVHALLHRLYRTGRAGHDARAQGGEVELVEQGVPQDAYEHGGDAVQGGGPLELHRHHDVDGVVPLKDDHGGSVVYTCHDGQHAAEAVEQGHREAYAVLGPEVLVDPHPITVVPDVVMREHDPLGEARGPGGVLHHDHVMGGQRGLPRHVVLLGGLGGHGHDLVHGVHPAVLLRAEEDDPLQVREPLGAEPVARLDLQLGHQLVEDADIVGVAVTIDDEDVLRLRLPQDVLYLRYLVVDVDRDEDGADARHRELQRDPMRHVGRPHGHLVALLDAERHEALGHPVHGVGELLPRLPVIAVGVYDRLVVRDPGHGLVQQLPQRDVPRDLPFHHVKHLMPACTRPRRWRRGRRWPLPPDEGPPSCSTCCPPPGAGRCSARISARPRPIPRL